MRILKNRSLEERWQSHSTSWDRELGLSSGGPSGRALPPRLLALVQGSLTGVTHAGDPGERTPCPLASFDVGEYVDDATRADPDATFLLAVKAAFMLATRLEPEGAFRVLVRSDVGLGGTTVRLRCFRRDSSHPRTPDELDTSACVLFVDTRRIDGARRPN